MKLDHLLIPHKRINSKWIKDLNVRLEMLKILEENIGNKILTLLVVVFYWIYLPRQSKIKEKINKWDYIKLRTFCTAKETINKIKRQPTKWENKFADASDKGLISEIYKLLTKLYASSLDWVKITQEQ